MSTSSHHPQPGPDYWAWRCLICDQPVANHRKNRVLDMTAKTIPARGIIFDGITAIFVIGLVIVNTAGATVRLITQPDRGPLLVGLDWLAILVAVVAVLISIVVTRRILASIEREDAKRADHRVAVYQTIKASHADPEDVARRIVDSTGQRP